MKKSELPRSTVPMQRKTPMQAKGQNAGPKFPKQRRARNTGPTAKVRQLVRVRSGGTCEWPTCGQDAIQQHHRLNRKQGGRHGEMAVRINQAAWLLDACHDHHAFVTSPSGGARITALAMGWLLLEHKDARTESVDTRHGRVWLTNDGGISTTPPTTSPDLPTA